MRNISAVLVRSFLRHSKAPIYATFASISWKVRKDPIPQFPAVSDCIDVYVDPRAQGVSLQNPTGTGTGTRGQSSKAAFVPLAALDYCYDHRRAKQQPRKLTMTAAVCVQKITELDAVKKSAPVDDSDCSSLNVAEGKSVRFSEKQNQIFHLNDDYEGIEINEIWFGGDEFIRIKAKSREESRQWRRLGYSVLLKECFLSNDPNVQDQLNAFCQLEEDLCRRGLERHLSKQHAEERSDCKDISRQAVLSTQKRMKNNEATIEEMIQMVSDAYVQQTRTSKIFAHRMGLADEYTVKEGCNSKAADKYLEVEDGGGGSRRMQRRLSNYSVVSTNSMDSRRRWSAMTERQKRRPTSASPASVSDDFYAAIA